MFTFWGKIIGGVIGFMSLGFWGALIGAGVGHLFDKGFASNARSATPEEKARIEQAFFKALFPLLGHMAKADGRVSEEEIASTEQLIKKMGLDDSSRKEAIRLFQLGAGEGFSLDEPLNNFKAACGNYRDLHQIFLVYLITLAFADGHLHEAEERILRQVAQSLGYSGFAFNHLIGMVRAQAHFYQQGRNEGEHFYQSGAGGAAASGNQLSLAYKALGVEESVTDSELKKAYRKLMSEYHPDKLAGRGVPEDMVKLATERSQEIQAAYELIKKHRKS